MLNFIKIKNILEKLVNSAYGCIFAVLLNRGNVRAIST